MNHFLPNPKDIQVVLTEVGLNAAQAALVTERLMDKLESEYDRVSEPLEDLLDSIRTDQTKSLEVLADAVTLALRRQIAELDTVQDLRSAIIAFLQWREASRRIPERVRETGIALNPFTPLLTPTRYVQQLASMLPNTGNNRKTRIRYYDPALQASILLEWPDHEITKLLVQAIRDACAFNLREDYAATLVLTNWIEDVPLIEASYRKPKAGMSIGYFQLTFADCLTVKEVQKAIEVLRYRSKWSYSKTNEVRKVEREKVPSLERLSLFVDAEIEYNPDVVARRRFKQEPKANAPNSRERASIRETKDWFAEYLGSNRQSEATQYLNARRRIRPDPWIGTLSIRERELIVDARLRMFAESQTYEDVTELTLANMTDDLPWARQVAFSQILASELPAKVELLEAEMAVDHVDKYEASIATAEKFIVQMHSQAVERGHFCEAVLFDDQGADLADEQKEPEAEDALFEKMVRERKWKLRRWAKPYDENVFIVFFCDCRELFIRYHLASVVSYYAQDRLDELAVALAKMVLHDKCFCQGALVFECPHYKRVSRPYWCSVAWWPEQQLSTRYVLR